MLLVERQKPLLCECEGGGGGGGLYISTRIPYSPVTTSACICVQDFLKQQIALN